MRARPLSRGFTLLEVLIAIVVVAFGLLGLAGLQVFALKNNASAAQRVTAINLATDIVDRMKANFQGVVNGSYDMGAAATVGVEASCATIGGCGSNLLARNDLFEWTQRVAAQLPGGVGIVCLDSTPNDVAPAPTPASCDNTGVTLYVVKIWWYDDRSQQGTPAPMKYLAVAFNP